MRDNILSHELPPTNLDRFSNEGEFQSPRTFGFQGYPEFSMFRPKKPLRQQQSADITQDTSRYFRKGPIDAPAEQQRYVPSPHRGGPSPQRGGPSPAGQHFQQDHPPADIVPHSTISPRYQDAGNTSNRRPPGVYDPLGTLSEAEKQKKMEESRISDEARELTERRKQNEIIAKREEQKQGNRKTKFTEHQMGKEEHDRRLAQYERDNMSPGRGTEPHFSHRHEDHHQGRDDHHHHPHHNGHNNDFGAEDMLHQQSEEVNKLRDKLDWLKSKDDSNIGRQGHHGHGYDRAHSDYEKSPLAIYTAKCENSNTAPSFLGYLFMKKKKEPQTERGYMNRHNPDGSPHRMPVGKLFYKTSTYDTDFTLPTNTRRRGTLGNPNRDTYSPFSPFGAQASGAPRQNEAGQRSTRIEGTMGNLGIERSESARLRMQKKRGLREEALTQIALQRNRKEQEEQEYKWSRSEPLTNKFGDRRRAHGGYSDYRLQQALSLKEPQDRSEQRDMHKILDVQTHEKHKMEKLGNIDSNQQDRKHYETFSNYFGKYGHGNKKGPMLQKQNLDKSIHHYDSTMNYKAGAPYAEY